MIKTKKFLIFSSALRIINARNVARICDLYEKHLTYKFNASVRGKPLTRLSGRRNHFSHHYFTWGCRREIRSDNYHGADASHTVNSLPVGERYTKLDWSWCMCMLAYRSSRGNPFKVMRCLYAEFKLVDALWHIPLIVFNALSKLQ